jgi:hypothetical protein
VARRLTVVSIAATALLFAFASSSAVARESQAASCLLQGTFKVHPALKADPAKIRYEISGKATQCHWTDGASESGTFRAAGSGVASCRDGTTRGVAHIRWDDHRTSTMRYSTTDVANAIELEGTFTEGASKGYDVHGLLFFVVDQNEPVGCLTEFGLNRATFYGVCERAKLN